MAVSRKSKSDPPRPPGNLEGGAPAAQGGKRRGQPRQPSRLSALRDRLELLEQVMESLPLWIAVNDATGRFVLVNEAMAKGHGLSAQDFIGRGFMEMEARGNPDLRLSAMLDSMVRSNDGPMERPRFAVRLPDGRERVHRMVKLPLKSRGGTTLGVVGWSEDITDRVLGEDTLEDHRKLLQAVFDMVPHPLAYTTREMVLDMVNQAWCRHVGVKRMEVIGRPILEVNLFSTAMRQQFYEENLRIVERGEAPEPREIDLPLPDGSVRRVVLSKAPVFGTGHVVQGVVALVMDITDMRRAEERAQLAHQRLLDAVEMLPAAIMLYGADNRLIVSNPMARQIYPGAQEALRPGALYRDLVEAVVQEFPVGDEERAKLVANRLSEFEQADRQSEIVTPGGRRLIGHDRRTTEGGTVIIRYDITEQKRIQAELEERQQQMRSELDLAARLQRQIFHAVAPPPFLALAHEYLPSSYVSGDLYHAAVAADGSFQFFLGDATGHGVGAALITMLVEAALREMADTVLPAEMAERLNSVLVNYRLDGSFVSGIFLRIAPDGLVMACNAGHPAALVLGAGGQTELESGGPPMGWFDGPGYETRAARLATGDRIVVYTDGLTERNDAGGVQFGAEGLKQVLLDQPDLPPAQLVPALLLASKRHAGGKTPADDLTLFVLEYRGTVPAQAPAPHEASGERRGR